ncbi:Protein ecdysoneless [Clonorchis sinensis]|uniref:Protein ecdysoneless n=1 Tax=Clonorchis sinensis TaxID=79923 RepID=A0A3R7D986_CLOSI|nr:Protein ecdysoneless [Clonorchis sinensis]
MTSKPRRETTVLYSIFSLDSTFDATRKHWDYCTLLAPWILAYPWYNERFRLYLQNASSNCYISGSVNFGESVEDEWFVVWLLYQLTTHDQNIVIQVEDEDGEFLLIEAADFLPKWLTPENSSNRIWIWNGQVGWLEQGKPGPLCQTEALRIMRNESLVNSIPLKFSEAINCAISRKIKGYPDRIQAMTHVAQVVLPYTAAALFSLPHAQILVGAATLALAAFQYDPVCCRKLLHSDGCLFRIGYKMRQNSAMSSTWPKLRDLPMNFFKTTCVFNRLHYARLRSLPTPTGVKYPRECNSVAERMAVELGLKLCTGLDLLLLSTKPTSRDIQRPTASFTNTATWEEFLKRLESLGYFRGELPGSRLHTQLLENAKSYFQDCVSEPGLCPSGDLSDHLTRTPADILWQLLGSIENDLSLVPSVAEFQKLEAKLPPADDESWLFVTPDELDAMLASHSNTREHTMNSSIADKLDRFMNASSSFQGVDLSPMKSGGKRRISPLTDDALVESEDSSHDETISDDSEDGYSEQLPRSQNNSTNEYTGWTMNMADMMRSLVNEIDGSHPAPSASLMGNQSTQMDPKVHFSDRVRPTVNKSNLLSSSSEDDLLDLYGPGSDARLDRFDRTLQPSSDDSSSDLQKWNAPVRHQKQPHKASQEAQNSTSLFQIVPPNFTRRTTKSVDSECSTDEEPTAGQVGWFKSSNGCSNNTAPDEGHSPHDEIGDAEKFSFKDYFALMEEELFGEPVNSGRCRSAAASARRPGMKKGLSHRKKPRHRHSSAVLAQPEQFDVSEGDYQLNSEDGESELSPDLEDHVTQNLFTSAVSSGQMPHAPTGAAAQLFTALGIPVHQMAAAISSKASKGGHVPRNEN